MASGKRARTDSICRSALYATTKISTLIEEDGNEEPSVAFEFIYPTPCMSIADSNVGQKSGASSVSIRRGGSRGSSRLGILIMNG